MRFSELRCREVISLSDGKRLGYISDLEIEPESGKIASLILPGPGKFKGLISGEEYRVPFCEIASVGADLILVNCYEQICPERRKDKHR